MGIKVKRRSVMDNKKLEEFLKNHNGYISTSEIESRCKPSEKNRCALFSILFAASHTFLKGVPPPSPLPPFEKGGRKLQILLFWGSIAKLKRSAFSAPHSKNKWNCQPGGTSRPCRGSPPHPRGAASAARSP